MIRALARFVVVSVVLVAVTAWMLRYFWTEPAASRAIWTSAVIALVVQGFAFAAVRLAAPTNVIAGWGVGVLLRLFVLVGYALLVKRAFGLPLAPALLSLVAFFFVTSIVEPLLLKS
jgi:hypothetical protein